ncbi:hypothetical protein [Geminocystis sp. NIES-3709]|uniref:hypothetical protein n=1 Tax=Geminocystis sp. NIES-3709 TaxID=1617448 RepID=UPI0005FCCCE1|nr:hypothetical protein [Geminocystis sp. NIES-3709]BAQ65274.1 cysteine sulfinate desulfinase/cysteine desulfurase and related enzymes [Geminocystis sp. NIES-3709]
MKIVEENSQLLHLENTNKIYLGRLFLFLFATPFFSAGIAVIIFLGKLNTLKCNHAIIPQAQIETQQISCQLTRQGLMRKETINIPQLYEVELGVSDSDDGETYRIELITSQGKIPLAEVYSSGSKNKRKKLKKIKSFIKNSNEDSLIIKQDDRFFAYPFGGIFVLVGGSLMVASLTFFRQIYCIFDKTKGKFFMREDNPFKSVIKEYRLGEIKRIEMLEEKDSDGDKVLKPKIILHRGLEIGIDLTGNMSEKEKTIKSINNFLQDLSGAENNRT